MALADVIKNTTSQPANELGGILSLVRTEDKKPCLAPTTRSVHSFSCCRGRQDKKSWHKTRPSALRFPYPEKSLVVGTRQEKFEDKHLSCLVPNFTCLVPCFLVLSCISVLRSSHSLVLRLPTHFVFILFLRCTTLYYLSTNSLKVNT